MDYTKIDKRPDSVSLSLSGTMTLWLAYAYFGEVVLSGPGSWSKVFLGFDLRKVLFFGVCSIFVAGIIRAGRVKLRDATIMFAGVLLFILWIVVMPTSKGTEMALAAADGTPIVSMFLITILFKIYSDNTDEERLVLYQKIADFVLMMAAISALVHLVLFFALTVFPDIGLELLVGLKLIFDNKEAGSIFVGPMPDGSIRVFWISSLFLVYGLYRAIIDLGFGVNAARTCRLLLFVAAILATQTRSIFLAVPVAFCVGAVFYLWARYSRGNLLSMTLGFTVVLFLITFIQLALVSTDVMSVIGLAREGSDEERGLQVGPLIAGWLGNFAVGGGFGYSVSYIRSDAAPYSYEFSILALYMKLGIAGLVVAWSYFIYMSNALARSVLPAWRLSAEYSGLVFLLFVYFFIFNTNPYLSNSVGVAIFLLLGIEAARLCKIPFDSRTAAEEGSK